MTDPLGLIGKAGNLSPQIGRTTQPVNPAGSPSFKDVLLKNIEQVNKLQQEADAAIEDLTIGKRDDLANVMIAQKKAETAFQMLMQVRNKLMDAYDEVKQMRV